MPFLLFFVFLSFQLRAETLTPSHAQYNSDLVSKISKGRMWLLLLRYDKSFFSGYKSMADGEKFFLSKNGKTDPTAELKANIDAFHQGASKDPNLHPQCRFPARYRYLKEAMSLKTKDRNCPDLNQWMESLQPRGLSLVFTASFPNNPGSTFGHTFLRILSKKTAGVQRGDLGGSKVDLLDYALSYAADVGDHGGLDYIIGGIFGGFPGVFTLNPYYTKVNEYNSFESRDLWEFELNLPEKGVQLSLFNIWEIGRQTYFEYYFLDENCSYHILPIIELARPQWHISDKFPVYVSPPETLRVTAEIPDAFREIKYRPSLFNTYKHRFRFLNNDQQDLFAELKSNPELSLKEVNDPSVLETLISYYIFKKKSNDNILAPKDVKRYQQLLVRRSQIKTTPPKGFDEIPRPRGPHKAHGDSLFSLGYGLTQNQNFIQLSYREMIHDILSDDTGYPEYSDMELMHVKLRYYPNEKDMDRKFSFGETQIANALSLFPRSEMSKKYSYHLPLTFEPLFFKGKLDQYMFNLAPKMGASWNIFSDRVLLYIMAGPYFQLSSKLTKGFHFGGAPQSGLFLNLSPFRFHFKYVYYAGIDRLNYSQATAEMSLTLSKDIEIRFHQKYYHLEHLNSPTHRESLLTLRRSF